MPPFSPPKLTFRTTPQGGEVRDPPLGCPGNVLTGQWQIILLIHGYNNNEAEGRQAYNGFRDLQRELGNLNPDQPVASGHLVDVYWPGDVGFFSAWNYPESLIRARAIAAFLAQALQRASEQSGLKLVDIVAHSMGTRLALELIRQLNTVPGVYVRRAVFMAGAVPTFMLEQGERLRVGFDNAGIEGVRSLYSQDDWVLRYLFPMGQERAGAGEWKDPAVALGCMRWEYSNAPTALDQYKISDAGHSDYWGWKSSTRENQGRKANIHVREFLGFADAGSREILTSETVGRETAPERVPGDAREITAREADGSEGYSCSEV